MLTDEEREALVGTVWEVLKSVSDPEMGLDIVNLGLVYDVKVVDLADNKDGLRVSIDLTLTSPACPMSGFIMEAVYSTVMGVDSKVNDVEVRLVWDPPWTQDRISDVGKMELGLI
jgi:metal-sulfur cluster biosynthetic enzyme